MSELLTSEWFDSLGWIPTYSGRYRNRFGPIFLFVKVDGSDCLIDQEPETERVKIEDGPEMTIHRHEINIDTIKTREDLNQLCRLFKIDLDQNCVQKDS